MYFKMVAFPSAVSKRGFFSDIHYENLVELLEVVQKRVGTSL